MKKLMEKKKLIIIVSVLCLMVFHMAGAGLYQNRFLNGTVIDGVDVSGMTIPELEEQIRKYSLRVIERHINAIASHTTGCPHMSLLDKIIYIADYIEPGRKELPNMAEVRKLAFTDIDICLYRILEDSLEYLAGRNVPIDPMTEKTYLYYKSKREEKEEQNG